MVSLDDLARDEFELLARLSIGYYEDGLTQEALASLERLTGMPVSKR